MNFIMCKLFLQDQQNILVLANYFKIKTLQETIFTFSLSDANNKSNHGQREPSSESSPWGSKQGPQQRTAHIAWRAENCNSSSFLALGTSCVLLARDEVLAAPTVHIEDDIKLLKGRPQFPDQLAKSKNRFRRRSLFNRV